MLARGISLAYGVNLMPVPAFHTPKRASVQLSPGQVAGVAEFNKQVANGEIEFESVPCLCGSSMFDLIASVDRYAMIQHTVICKLCGLVQSNPRMSDLAYRQFYSSDLYRSIYDSDTSEVYYRTQKYIPQTGSHIFEALKQLRNIGPETRVLEVGAGGGWNLLPFKAAGATVCGIDYSLMLVKLGQEFGIDMRRGGVEALQGTHDVILINHVLEHMLNPVECLRTIAHHLSEDGVVYVGVPNILNFDMTALQNAHTYYFTPTTLNDVASSAGLLEVESGPAEEIHMYGVYRRTTTPAAVDLSHHFEEMVRVLRRRRTIERISRLFDAVHLSSVVDLLRKLKAAARRAVSHASHKDGVL